MSLDHLPGIVNDGLFIVNDHFEVSFMKRRSELPSTNVIGLRCTTREHSLWKRLAQRKNKTLPNLVRDGLNNAAKQLCLCQPGEPICYHCSQATPA